MSRMTEPALTSSGPATDHLQTARSGPPVTKHVEDIDRATCWGVQVPNWPLGKTTRALTSPVTLAGRVAS